MKNVVSIYPTRILNFQCKFFWNVIYNFYFFAVIGIQRFLWKHYMISRKCRRVSPVVYLYITVRVTKVNIISIRRSRHRFDVFVKIVFCNNSKRNSNTAHELSIYYSKSATLSVYRNSFVSVTINSCSIVQQKILNVRFVCKN